MLAAVLMLGAVILMARRRRAATKAASLESGVSYTNSNSSDTLSTSAELYSSTMLSVTSLTSDKPVKSPKPIPAPRIYSQTPDLMVAPPGGGHYAIPGDPREEMGDRDDEMVKFAFDFSIQEKFSKPNEEKFLYFFSKCMFHFFIIYIFDSLSSIHHLQLQ